MVEAALRVVERDGVDALTMRRLAEELGAAVTAIYWHVGNRAAVVDLLVERLLAEMGEIRPRGREPRARIVRLAGDLRARLLERPHLVGLADQQGKTVVMFRPVQAALATELAAMGVVGERATQVIQLVQYLVITSVLFSRAARRSPALRSTELSDREAPVADAPMAEALRRPTDVDGAFAVSLEAVLDRLLPGCSDQTPRPDPG